MRIAVNGKHLFFDIEGPEYVPGGDTLRRLPTLVLIHGSPGNSDHSVFKPAFSALRDVARIVYLDLSGAGRSDDEPGNRFSLERWADDLVNVLRGARNRKAHRTWRLGRRVRRHGLRPEIP